MTWARIALEGLRGRASWAVPALRGVLYGAGVYLLLLGLLNSPLVSRPVLAVARASLSRRVASAQLGTSFSVSPLGNLRMGPLSLGPADAPTVRVETLAFRPKLWPLLVGRVELQAVMLRDVEIEAGDRGEPLEALWTELQGDSRPGAGPRASQGASLRPLPEIHFRSLKVHARTGTPAAPEVTLGPVNGRIRGERGPDGRRLDVVILPPGGGAVRFELTQSPSRIVVRAAAEALTPEALPQKLTALLPVRVTRGTLDGTGTVDWPRPGALKSNLSVTLSDVFVQGERLAAEEVGPLTVRLIAGARASVDAQQVVLDRADVFMGPGSALRVQAQGELAGMTAPRFGLTLSAPALDYTALLAALPPALQPGREVPRHPGTFSAQLKLGGELLDPSTWDVEAAMNLEAMRKAWRGQPFFVNGAFTHRFVGNEGRSRDVRIGPDNPYYVGLEELPEHVVRAVTVSEDAGFFGHQGFDFSELKNAIAEGAEAGRIVRGGSTITQQLAKNLFLSRHKTFARKVQEALATLALEAGTSKRRLLEVYLNLIEWGPGIHGIGEAARHYFDKHPRDLTVKEAVFLATIIPNPVRYHVYFTRKSLTENWEKRVEELLVKLRNVGVLSDEELESALKEPLAFAQG